MDNKYKIKSDLAIELVKEKIKTIKVDNIKVTKIKINKKQSQIIGKKIGIYITIEFPDITNYASTYKLKTVLASELKKLLKDLKITSKNTCLVMGLGNDKITPDAVGPFTVDKIMVTNHLYLYQQLDKKYRRVYALSPGVMGETGIETKDLLKGIIKAIKPDFIITIDGLAASSIERVNKTIQITDAGINPGSGVGNKRKEISKKTLGVPVIAIGMPTVVDAASIVNDTIHYIYEKYSLNSKEDKENLLGIVGSLNDKNVKSLIYDVLNPIGFNLMVTPEEEDIIIDKASEIISGGINMALHDIKK